MTISTSVHDVNYTIQIDKLSLTIGVDVEQQELFHQKIESAFKYCKLTYKKTRGLERYRNNIEFKLSTKSNLKKIGLKCTVLISFDSINKNHRYFRIEYNPSLLSPRGHKKLRRLLIKLLNVTNFNNIYKKANITRIDTALDIEGRTPEDYMFYVRKVSICAIHTGKSGFIESIYVGSSKSKELTKIYAKEAQLISNAEKKKIAKLVINSLKQSENILRLENVYRKAKYFINTLHTKPNPFGDVEVFSPITDGTKFHPCFKDSCRVRGLNAALSLIEDKENKRYRRYLRKYNAIDIVSSKELTSHWKYVVDSDLYSLYPTDEYKKYLNKKTDK